MKLTNNGTTLMFAIDDTDAGHNVPSMTLGKTESGEDIFAKAVFPDEQSAQMMASFMNSRPGAHPERFQVVAVELWRPTDIEIYVRDRIRDAEDKKGPKLVLPF